MYQEPFYNPRPANKIGDIYLYTVKQGDYVYSIAKAMNSNVDMILCMNHLNQDSIIYPNQQLLVPVLYKTMTRNEYDLYF